MGLNHRHRDVCFHRFPEEGGAALSALSVHPIQSDGVKLSEGLLLLLFLIYRSQNII